MLVNLNKILPYLKKKYNCNGHIADDENFGKIISLSGNQKNNVFNFIIENDIEKPENIIIKGVWKYNIIFSVIFVANSFNL